MSAALLLASCSALAPITLPPERTPPPATSELWTAVDAATAGSWHVLLNDGSSALEWRLRAIDSASESIEFQTFLWHFDRVGALVLDHLIRAAERGVAVRILVDDTFLVHEDPMLLALADHPRIQYRVFNPFKRRFGGIVTRQLLNLAEFHRLDHRMHNKAMVVDNRVAIVGGRNIADEYFGLDEEANFRDLELLLGGPVVEEVGAAFDAYWNDPWSFPLGTLSDATASPAALAAARRVRVASPPQTESETTAERASHWRQVMADADGGDAILYVDRPPQGNPRNPEEAPVQVAEDLVALLEHAQREIVVVSAYLIPTPRLEDAVARAVARGVRVRILTNSIGSNNHLTAHSAYRNHIGALLAHGAELHEVRTDARDRHRYMTRPIGRKRLALHAKALIVDDDKVFIGSANLDPRSLRINTEMGFLIVSAAFNAEVRRAVEADFTAANAWRLQLQDDGGVHWVSDDTTLTAQPAISDMQRLEDWLFSHLPLEAEL